MPSSSTSKSLAWGFVLWSSAAAGALFASLTILAWIHGWEGRVALVGLTVLAILVVRRCPHRTVLHGFLVGFFSALVAIELQAAFLPTYFANNPEYAQIEIPFGLSARSATALMAPMPATVAGLLTAGLVWTRKALRKRLSAQAKR